MVDCAYFLLSGGVQRERAKPTRGHGGREFRYTLPAPARVMSRLLGSGLRLAKGGSSYPLHEAIQGWTATVDIKASIVIAIETAVAGAAASEIIAKHGQLHDAIGLHLATAIAALAALAAAIGSGLWVVFPRLERTSIEREAPDGLIYFGHLRSRDTEDIAQALERLTVEEERLQVARQLRVTGNVAWRKHAWLQASIVLFAIGAALLVTSLVGFLAWQISRGWIIRRTS
jgi:Family of unknown function (DUF5706)